MTAALRRSCERVVGVAGCVEAEALDVGLDEAPTSQVEHLGQLGSVPQ